MEYHSGGSLPLLGRPRYCPGAKANGGYLCETGHCCGETGCCTYYYELWWFWLLWTLLILFSCCCAYRHRRAKLRVQQQQQQQQQQRQQRRESSLLAYRGASSYPSSMLDLSFLASLKLPSYEEVAAQPSTPPPPYSSVFTTPRYPQPPRTSEPHLLTQHPGPLLHRRLSDGPSSFSSDNSSSCSCDSCCPSSLCSSSVSAPITDETDTSRATTPSEATPLTLEVQVESVAAAGCPQRKDGRFAPEPRSGPAREEASGPSQPLPTEAWLGDRPPSGPASACPKRPPDPSAAPQPAQAYGPDGPDVLIQVKSCEDPAEGPPGPPAGTVPSLSGPSSPAFSPPDSPTSPPNPDLSRTFSRRSLGPGPVSEPPLDCGSASALFPAGSLERPPPDPAPACLPPAPPSHRLGPGPGPGPAALNPGQASTLGCSGFLTMRNPPQDGAWPSTLLSPGQSSEPLAQDPDPLGLRVPGPQTGPGSSGKAAGTPEPALTAPSSSRYPGPDLASRSFLVPEAPKPGPRPGPAPGPDPPAAQSGPSLLTPQVCLMVPPAPDVQTAGSPGPEGASLPASVQLSPRGPALGSGPAITIQAEPPAAVSPPSPPALTSTSLPATILLLDPLSVPHQAGKGGSSSGHASSLSPSPRTTQSPPKQTLFSPCVDVFQPEPLSWEDEDEEEEEEENEEEEEDVGADESQYRHRRLTGDSGIEVCRCRVDEEGEELGREEGKRGRGHGERDGKGSAGTDLHDSVDCPARREEGHTPTRPPPPEGGDKAVVVMETA